MINFGQVFDYRREAIGKFQVIQRIKYGVDI